MSGSTKLATTAPHSKERLAVYKRMTSATRKIADEFTDTLMKQNRSTILAAYTLGTRIAAVMNDEATYGTDAVRQLAAYFGCPAGPKTLTDYKRFAEEFDREFVGEQSSVAMNDGRFLELGHWMILLRVDGRDEQQRLLNRIRRDCLSVGQLADEVKAGLARLKHTRQGGRPQTIPVNAVVGLRVGFQQTQKLVNYIPILEENTFSEIDEMPPDRINPILLDNLQNFRDKLTELVSKSGKVLSHLDKGIERVVSVLQQKEHEPAEAEAEVEAAADVEDAGEVAAAEDVEEAVATAPRKAARAAGKKAAGKKAAGKKKAAAAPAPALAGDRAAKKTKKKKRREAAPAAG